jgi:glycosyltransferase involved in cell wall biosynthesis
MRILYLSDNNSEHNRRFLTKLASAGHEVFFCDISNSFTSRPLPTSVHTVNFEHGPPSASPQNVQSLLPELKSLLSQLQPDLVHAGPVQTSGYLAALSDFHPLLLMSWGSDVLLYAARGPDWRHATEKTLRAADAFFCDCNSVRKKAIEFAALRDDQIVQFPWGIPGGVFSPQGALPSEEVFTREPGMTVFICTRAWETLYGIEVLLQGFRDAHRRNPSLRLLLLGSGSQSEWMQAFIRNNGLQQVVCLVGRVRSQDLPAWFRAANAYVSCAKSDGTSISLLEAMATGLPVIVTDIPSNREWVLEGDNGWLTEIDSPRALTRKLLRVPSLTLEERTSISRSNQRVVAERADWDRNFPRLLEMYERIAVVGVRR